MRSIEWVRSSPIWVCRQVMSRPGGSSSRILYRGSKSRLEGLLTQGVLQPLAMFDKPDPLNGPFFEETIYITPSRLSSDLQQNIVACASRTAEALGLREGPVHGEFRVNENGVWVIEMAGRSIGGRCSRTLDFASGMSLEELILRHALRMPLPPLTRQKQSAGVMMLPIPYGGMLHEVRGQVEAKAVPGIVELTITAEPGDELVPLPEGTRYLGFLLARGATPEDVERVASGRAPPVDGGHQRLARHTNRLIARAIKIPSHELLIGHSQSHVAAARWPTDTLALASSASSEPLRSCSATTRPDSCPVPPRPGGRSYRAPMRPARPHHRLSRPS